MKISHLMIYPICNLLVAVFIISGCDCSNMLKTETKKTEKKHSKLHLMEKKEYHECFVFHEQYDMFWPQRNVQIETNHALRIEWSNFEEFKEFFEDQKGILMITFVVEKRDVYKIASQSRWNNIVYCKILAIEYK